MKKVIKGCLGCFGVFICGILILIGGLYIYAEWIYEEWPTERIERITGVRVPDFKVIKTFEGERHFTGDFMDTLIIEFETVPPEELFIEIDRKIATSKTKWKKTGDRYSFFTAWGNGYPAPVGESEGADGIFGITITNGKKMGKIIDGAW